MTLFKTALNIINNFFYFINFRMNKLIFRYLIKGIYVFCKTLPDLFKTSEDFLKRFRNLLSKVNLFMFVKQMNC